MKAHMKYATYHICRCQQRHLNKQSLNRCAVRRVSGKYSDVWSDKMSSDKEEQVISQV